MQPVVVVHGGAGKAAADDSPERAIRGCEAAAQAAYRMLAQGASALDAVEEAARLLEDDPVFNAGTGACLTADGEVELDAALMDGEGLRFGAVGAVRGVKNPIQLARLVMERTPHALLVADGALALAEQHGVARVDPQTLITPRARARYEAEKARRLAPKNGTIGAVAIDAQGRLAAATSTGGTSFKLKGRLGDTPLPGAGTYAAAQAGAASATGHGESILRVCLTHQACTAMRGGLSAQAAVEQAIEALGRIGGDGGLIAVDARGGFGVAFNTERMARAWVAGPENAHSGFGR